MSKEQNSSYVMNEKVSHSEKQENNHTPHNSWEVLQSFQHHVSHLDTMIKKVNTLDKNSIKNTDTINILNTLLQKSKLWGNNGWLESKAYFKKHEGQIVLVLNAVVNGEEVNSFGDINAILANIDTLLIKNPIDSKISPEKKEIASGEKLQRANKRLAQYERQIQEINVSYRENTDDRFMVMDAIVDTWWGESGKKIYGDHLQSIQKNIEQEYRSFIISLVWLELSMEDEKKIYSYRKRVENLLWKKLEDVQSFTGYLVTEKKLDSAINVAYAVKGMAEWAIEAIIGTAVFAFLWTTHPELRDAVYSSIGSFYDYLKENHSNYEKLWKDFCKAFEKESKKFQELPSEQQAEAIGKITGNIIATILGAKAMNVAIKSGKLRLKFKVPEIPTNSIKAPLKFKATESTKNNTKFSTKKRSKTGDTKEEAKTPEKTIADIEKVKNWEDLDSFMSTIDRVRFKEWLTGKAIQEMISEVRQWTRHIKDIPDYGWIRGIVDTLKRNWGIIPETTGLGKATQVASRVVGKGVERIQDIIPFKDARKFLHKNILTGYDHVDINITKLYMLTNAKIGVLWDGIAQIVHIKEMRELVEKTTESVKVISFPGKEALLVNLEKLSLSLTAMKGGFMEANEWVSHKTSSRLTKREFQSLRFEEGFAVREMEKDGKTFYEYRDVKGRKVFEEYTYASHFKDGKATVTKVITKIDERTGLPKEVIKNYTIDRKGIQIGEDIEASFGSIQRFKNGGYRVFDGEYYQLKYPKGHKNDKSRYYTFMTEIQCDMVVGVDRANGVKYIINGNGDRFKTPFHYVDDFTEEGVAAVKNKIPDGKWLLIDKEWNILGKDNKGKIRIIRRNENIITKDKKWNFIDGNGNPKTLEDAIIQEQEFEIKWHKDNLGALKAFSEAHKAKEHNVYEAQNPEITKKQRKMDTLALSEILKKNNIELPKRLVFKNTTNEKILLYQDRDNKGGKMGIQIVNLEKGTISKESFSYIHTPDIDNGFIRVSPINNKERMWVINLNGEYIVQPKYVDIQIHDDKKRLFKVFETREIGEKLKNGTVIEKHFSDPNGAQKVKRIGLTDGRGNVIIETGYTEITQSNDIMAQGLIRWEKYGILHESKKYNIEKYAYTVTDAASSTNQTMTALAILAAEWPMVLEKTRRGSLNIVRSETSMVLSEIKSNELSLLMSGTQKINRNSSPQIQDFMKNKVPTIRDVWTLETKIGEIIQSGTDESVRKYLEENGLQMLTKAERITVADYEKETRKSLLQAIRTQVKNEQMIFRNGKWNDREKFVNTLVSNLHPELHKALGGTGEILREEMKKAA